MAEAPNDKENSGEANTVPQVEEIVEGIFSDPDIIVNMFQTILSLNQLIQLIQSIQSLFQISDSDWLNTLVNLESCSVALVIAISSNNTNIVESLVSKGVDVNLNLFGFTPLHMAVSCHGNMNMVKSLIDLGANVNAKTYYGDNCIDLALQFNQLDLVKYFIDLGVTGDDDESLVTETPDNDETFTEMMPKIINEIGQQLNLTQLVFIKLMLADHNAEQFCKQAGNISATCSPSEGQSLLTHILIGNLDGVKCLIKLGADINAQDDEDQWNCLHTAAFSNNIAVVEYLVSKGADVNCKEVDDNTPLLLVAACENRKDMAMCLIRLGADVNARNKNQQNCLHLHAASHSNNPDLVEYLVSQGLDVNCKDVNDVTPLMLAAKKGNMDMVKCLIDHGADVNARDTDQRNCLHYASQSNNPGLVEHLVSKDADVNCKDVNDITPLMRAAEKGSKCADVNCKDVNDATPLIIAAGKGNMDTVKCLIGLGADVNARDTDQRNCLHFASQSNNPDLVEHLVSKDADVNCKDVYDITPLMRAAEKGNMAMVKCLIDHGADVNASDKDQWNCLHYAAKAKNPGLVQNLVSQGADVNCKDNEGRSPLFLSLSYKDDETVFVLTYFMREQTNCPSNNAHELDPSASSADAHELDPSASSADAHELDPSAEKADAHELESFVEKADTHELDPSASSADAHELESSAEEADAHASEIDPSAEEENLHEIDPEADPLVLCAKLGYLFGARSVLDAGVNINTLLKQISLYYSCRLGHTDITRLLLLTGEEYYEMSDSRGENIFGISPFSSVIDYTSILLDGLSNFHQPQTTILESLICMPGVGNVLELPNTTASSVHEAVLEFLSPVPKSMSKIYSNAELIICGSVGEGTKVGLPNEMDILFPVEYNKKCNYIAATQIRSDFVEFCAPGDFAQGSILFHETFYDQWSQAFDSCPETNFVSKITLGEGVSSIRKMNRKACTPLLLLYHINKAKIISVSIDIVPCVLINNWLDNFISKTWLMDHCELKKKGYILVPKPPHRKSKIADQFTEQQMEELWRISFSHLEVEHIKSLEDRIRNVYVAAKCLRNPDVCRIMITEGEGLPKNVDDYISSYMLKSMFLKNVEHFLRPHHRQSLEEMVCKVYDDLDVALHKGFIPTFFMPTVNVLDGLKVDEGKSAKVARIMKTFVRRFCSGDTIDEDVQGKYNVYNIMNDKWTTANLKLRRPIEEFTVYKRTWPYYQRE